jgi:acyl-coenzyme A thioesterase PaaI-like protein
MRASTLRRLVNLWPPLLFSGIKATHISEDFRRVDVVLKLRWYNRNYVGTHYGGSLFSMTDPWYMLMLMHNLGPDYFVWDKSAEIDFIAPGRGVVGAHFSLDKFLLDDIRKHTDGGEKHLPQFTIDIIDADRNLVARVNRTLYIRRKPKARQVAMAR